jgi:hypothetical protein
MTKSWSSFEGQQLLQENWRSFLSEESEQAKHLRKRGYSTGDYWEDAEESEEQEGDPQASNFPDVSTGLDSDYKQDSLKQVLGRLTPPLNPDHIQALIGVIAQIAGDEGIMLELSLKGLNSEQDRIIDSAGTAQILNTIAGWNLPVKESTGLIKALNYWGRVNSVKFTAPPAAAPAVANTTDPLDDVPQDTTTPDEPEPEPEPETFPELEPLEYPDLDNSTGLPDAAPFPELEPLEYPDLDNSTGLPDAAPPGYDKSPYGIFISMIPYPSQWDAITDSNWALYRDLNPQGENAHESGLFAWSPNNDKHPDGLWVRPNMDPGDLTDLPIKENLLERWQIIAGINKRIL